ncbi:COG4223 family protein [Rhizobium panacihumi]|uniref:COG4223 family protein n=1 Tax=Rhizobium panacihumi TaxID=2008450 RepID=UPI003D7A5C41
MVSDKPPRRSKSDKSPVTIDLAAEDVSMIATPVRSDDSDVPVAAAKTDAKAADTSKPLSAKEDTVTSKAETAKPADTKIADVKPAAAGSTATGKVEPTKPAEPLKTGTSSGPGTSAPASTPTPAATASPGSSASTSGSNSASANTVDGSANAGAPKNFGTNTTSASSTAGASSTTAKSDPQPKPATSGDGATSAAKAPARPAPATSSLIAAGIFGGIIALALAGSMFYAGVIPGASGGNTTETGALQQQIDSLNQQLASSTSAIEALKTAATAGTGNVGTEIAERLAALEARIAEAGSNSAASDALTQRLAALESKVDQPGREEAVAKALAASALKTAIDRGGPFTGELQTFSGISGNEPAVQTLEKFAQSGVPSASDLVQKFPQTATTILNAAHQMDEQAGVGSRLLSSAMQMFKVRPVGDVEGDTPEAVVARMEDKLRKGDLKGASTEWEALPQPAKDASVAYKQTLDARIEVDGLVDNTLNRAISGASNAG